jgi:hypothetical protein
MNSSVLDDVLLIVDESCMKLFEIAWIFCLDVDTCLKTEQFCFISYMNHLKIVYEFSVN